jgi:hypothetical protein
MKVRRALSQDDMLKVQREDGDVSETGKKLEKRVIEDKDEQQAAAEMQVECVLYRKCSLYSELRDRGPGPPATAT